MANSGLGERTHYAKAVSAADPYVCLHQCKTEASHLQSHRPCRGGGVQGQPPLGLMADCIWNPVKPYARVIEIDTFKAARLVAEASGLLAQLYLYLFYF